MPEKTRRIVSLPEAAKIANVNPRTLRRYIAAGRLAGYRVGPRLVKVDLSDVEALLEPIGAGV